MKIAMVHTSLWGRGGAERQLLSLAIELQKLGNEVEIFTPQVNEKTCYPELLKQVKVNVLSYNRFVPFKNDSNTYFDEALVGRSFRNQVQRIAVHQFYTSGLPAMVNLGRMIPEGFDIINNHNPPSEWAAFIAKNRLKIPVVWMCNEPPTWFSSEHKSVRKKISWPLFEIWDRTSVEYIDKIIVLSHVAETMVRNAYNKPSMVVRTGIDSEKLQNVSGEAVRRKLGLENDFVLLHVANFDPKRQSDSIKALSYLSKNNSNIKLILDGAGPREELQKLCRNLGVENKVFFIRSKCDNDLAKVYASCDVFLFPQQITWGLAVVEAMASAKPVIVAKGCGVAEIIQDNVNGMIVENGKADEIAKKIENLITNPSLREKIGRNAETYVKEHLSWEKYARTMEEVFEKVVKNN
jgi:glycosyltransferase involved in cell wall biosynthesis